MVVQIASSIGVTAAAPPQARPFFFVWLGIVLTVAAARLLVAVALGRELDGGRRDAILKGLALGQNAGLLVSATLWALLACWRMPLDGAQSRYMILIVVSALAGGAIGVLAPLKWTGRLYVTILLVPASVALGMSGTGDTVLGILGFAFWGVMIAGHRNNYNLLCESIRLREANTVLIADVEARNLAIAEINRDLEKRVADRTADLQTMTFKAEAANRAKSEFLETISHELRTPLNGIVGLTRILAAGELGEAQGAQLAALSASSAILQGLVDDLIDLTCIDDGGLTFTPRNFNLRGLAARLETVHGQAARDVGLAISFEVSPECPLERRGDEDFLVKIAGHLIANAVKFTASGRIDIVIDGDSDRFCLAVSDTGPGIAAVDQARIFDRFTQLDAASTRQFGGAGLGLSICRDLAELMGGTIAVESRPGEGATFRLDLPFKAVVAAAPAELSIPAALATEEQILIVEDNPTNRLVLQTLLSHLGVSSAFACNGQEAVEAWRSRSWDGILMDIHMPVIDGLEATRTIRGLERDSGRPRTPIIAVTASALVGAGQGFREMGLDAVVAKPVAIETLVTVLETYVYASAA